MTNHGKVVAVVGTGPAGLMVADVLASAGITVKLFEQRPQISWKLYIAGGSGLNISNNLALSEFVHYYTGPGQFWTRCLQKFSTEHWLRFIEEELGLGTFLGTSGRYFVETMHAAKLIRLWKRRLEELGVTFHLNHRCKDFVAVDGKNGGYELMFESHENSHCDAVCFALGGGSYLSEPPEWTAMFAKKGITFHPFAPSNTGFEIAWKPEFLQEAEGLPLKNVKLHTERGERQGDLVVTSYGLEGTPIYFVGKTGKAQLDLKPDLTLEVIKKRLAKTRENYSPLRRAQKQINLSPAVQALLFHMAPRDMLADIDKLAVGLKTFPLQLLKPRPLSESISSSGGVGWDAINDALMLKQYPNVFLAGEMIDWDAPTGGFLIQGCISQGRWVGERIRESLA